MEHTNRKSRVILLTGATGMIGTALINQVIRTNETEDSTFIIAFGRSEEKARQRLGQYWNSPYFSFVEHDINLPIPEAMLNGKKVDAIIHGASTTHPVDYANYPVDTMTTNFTGAKNLLDFAVRNQISNFVFLSSVEVYGENRGDTETFDETYCGYLDCNTLRGGYPESKRAAEALCQAYRKEYGIRVVTARLSRVYGPTMQDSDSKAIAQFIKKAVKGEDIVLKSRGNQLYSYTYVTDAAAAILFLLEKGKDGEAYNISDHESEITLKELAAILADLSGGSVIFELPDQNEQMGYSKVEKALLSTEKIEKLGWKAEVHIKQGLKKTLEFLRSS